VAEQPGITDFIFDRQGAAGIVVPQEDPDAIAAAAMGLLSDPRRAEAMGRDARARAIERFDIERIADRYVDLYTDVIAGMKGGRGVQR
jgi:glycosyltransferase involved in cell wall biosynthesis